MDNEAEELSEQMEQDYRRYPHPLSTEDNV